jgi:uncharacterized damage-inducible protein DinB
LGIAAPPSTSGARWISLGFNAQYRLIQAGTTLKEQKMDTVELLQYSLGFAFAILKQVTAELTQEQADWSPPGTASSITAIYWHTLTYVDYFVREYCIEGKRLPETVESRPDVLKMQAVEANVSELHQFASDVESTVQGWLSSLTPADLDRRRHTTAAELNVGQMMEIYIVWHINVHCGEISALKGCQGLKGYPF